MNKYQKNFGFGMIEVIICLGVIFVGTFVLIGVYNYYLKFSLLHKYDVGAALLLEEGVEAIKTMRDSGWQTNIVPLVSGRSYSLEFTNGAWLATTTYKFLDRIFDRRFVLSDVYRNSSYEISPTGTFDSGTKLFTVTVYYGTGLGTTTRSMSAYLTNIFNN